MSFDTIDENQTRQILEEYQQIWLFGYGSLIYKVDFPILASQPASIKGWKRRFWQGSHDHRGTPDKPGRVATLIEDATANCVGVAYRVTANEFEHLDHREKNGYLRYEIDIHFDQGHSPSYKTIKGLVYIAPTDNHAYLGQAPEEDIAKHIFDSAGPSGENKDYVFSLAESLREMEEYDEHVFEIEKYLNKFSERA